MTLIAILLPWVSFLLRGKLLSGIICLLLQLTLIGWVPAAIWAVISLQNGRADKRNEKLIRALQKRNY
ncbi:MAG: YqaE/Pmp3 family membrane protein [Bacteroidetes bacterium]|nr:YqaE/Pmp3 family membrane protein [Bacteroidota bacterium]